MDHLSLHSRRAVVTAITTLALALCASVPAATAAGAPAEWDGLERVPSERHNFIYVRPGASLAGYKRLQLDRVEVAFDKSWNPNRDIRELSRKLSKADMEAIKADLATEFRKVFKEELGKGGYPVVDQSGEDVLRVTARIVDLYINAPDKPGVNRVRTFVANAGQMTLVAELRDSITGQVLARVVDRQQGAESGRVRIATSVTNAAETDRILAGWANQLRKGLDELKTKTAGK